MTESRKHAEALATFGRALMQQQAEAKTERRRQRLFAVTAPLGERYETPDGETLYVRYCDGCGLRRLCHKQVVMAYGEVDDILYFCPTDYA